MNLPNKLTLFRIILVPLIVLIRIFPYAYFNIPVMQLQFGWVSLSLLNLICLFIFLLAAITDYFDGMIARKHNLITTFGKFADPIADKLLVNTMFILFASDNIIPVVPVILMILRDTIVDGIRMIASKNGVVVAAGYLGKIKTVAQMIAIVLILLNNLPFELYKIAMSDFALWFATFVSIASGVSYFIQMKEFIFESK
ncbi:MAG: CDP-diacylglycerol--glycerol-3-phosphate 3-phosphatidyltransferase [Erysipelotrichaceae bacterium]|nr:CDP-diacylglycerol--glycerol-3-phosphate 3-phosphatidyltransferase [Erysipelotrichaceae bacterium]MDO5085315.1 CDP-diacylglycerol--glycerol-3-phosphate 3-phosphatidyltransferase [Erysipelotrichaceae bacterium]